MLGAAATVCRFESNEEHAMIITLWQRETMPRRCQYCRFWMGGNAEIGACHRNPPATQISNERPGKPYNGWPETSRVDWCGDFSPKRVSGEANK